MGVWSGLWRERKFRLNNKVIVQPGLPEGPKGDIFATARCRVVLSHRPRI